MIRNSVSNCCVIPECVAGVSIGAISNKPNLVIQQEKETTRSVFDSAVQIRTNFCTVY